MSSHHFVREGQEPALLILDPVGFELAGPFLEWAPVVLVSEIALDDVLSWGIKLDAVLVSREREAIVVAKVADQAPVEIITMEPGASPVIPAFSYLISVKQAGVNVLTFTPDAVFDHAEVANSQLHVNIVDGTTIWSGISAGRFEKWVTAKAPFSIRQRLDSHSIVVQGLTRKGDRFESVEEGMISIRSNSFFWVAESYS
jgi:hypothetical protein